MAESSNANAMVSGLKNENILKTIGYFWSDALNCFMFGHGPMTPTLLDVAMITGLDIASPSPSAFKPKNQIPNFPPLATCTFPDANGKQIRCTSYGQALYSLPGSKLIPKEASEWFRTFFQGLDNPLFFPYTESENFENPVPSVGMSTSNRIIKPGYESYQPVVVARQLGLGQVSPHFFLHHLTASRAELPDILTSQRCYTFFDALAIPIPHNLRFTTTTDGFETWWSMWKTHAFRRALGPLLKQLDAESDVPACQQQDGPEPTQADGSPFKFLPPAPVVLFCQSSPPLKKVIMQSQPISPKSAPKSKASSGPVAPRASIQAKAVRKVAARKTLKRQAPTPAQESLHTNETSSGDVEEVLMPSATLDLATSTSTADKVANLAKSTEKPITTTSAAPPTLGEGCDLSSLLTFDPESIEPATSKAGEEPSPSTVHGPLQRLKALLSSSVETLVENPEAVKGILEDIQPHLPVTLQTSVNGSTRKRLPWTPKLTPLSTAELETLRKELENLEERVRVTKQLIQDKEALIARSQEEAKGLKTDLAEIRALSSQLVTGKDEDDEAEIAEVDRIRADALHALNRFFSRAFLCKR
ncbi:hypothetical protein QYE76_056825 [Lolium multiflorum]|uniref:Aminotransferase-like plant mobile domain-containing protein n=1 Tax=Lolium multiflorum TaxID=4521 RepID=A0AAD8WNH7_LOLMU|nr:hypothetical protein QYE76_056825 [Lolium multiflorum]